MGVDPCRGFRCPKCGACGVDCSELQHVLFETHSIYDIVSNLSTMPSQKLRRSQSCAVGRLSQGLSSASVCSPDHAQLLLHACDMSLNCGAKVPLECEGLKKGRASKALLAKNALRRLLRTRAW